MKSPSCVYYWHMSVVGCMVANLILLVSVVQAQVTKHAIHECYLDYDTKISITCNGTGRIVIETAILGTSKGWTAGSRNCTRNDDNCLQVVDEPFEQCDMELTCALNKSIFKKDLHNNCLLPNFIIIEYACVPETFVNQRSINMCEDMDHHDHIASGGYISYNFNNSFIPDKKKQTCSCSIQSYNHTQLSINVTAVYVIIRGPVSPECKDALELDGIIPEMCPKAIIERSNRSKNGTASLYNGLLAISFGINAEETYSIQLTTSSRSTNYPSSRILLHIAATHFVRIHCCSDASESCMGSPDGGATMPTQDPSIPGSTTLTSTVAATTLNTEEEKINKFPLVAVVTAVCVLVVIIIIVVAVVGVVMMRRRRKNEPPEDYNTLRISTGSDVTRGTVLPAKCSVNNEDGVYVGGTDIIDNANYSVFRDSGETDAQTVVPITITTKDTSSQKPTKSGNTSFDNPDYWDETIYPQKLNIRDSTGQDKYEEIPCDQPKTSLSTDTSDGDDIYFEIDENHPKNVPTDVTTSEQTISPSNKPTNPYEDVTLDKIEELAKDSETGEIGQPVNTTMEGSRVTVNRTTPLPALPGGMPGLNADYSEIWSPAVNPDENK